MEFKLLATNQRRLPITRDSIFIKWNPSEPNTYKLNVDGSCLENLGKGGIYRRSYQKRQMGLGFYMSIPHALNIYMETLVLLHGLTLSIDNNYLPLTIETDCKELINLLDNKIVPII